MKIHSRYFIPILVLLVLTTITLACGDSTSTSEPVISTATQAEEKEVEPSEVVLPTEESQEDQPTATTEATEEPEEPTEAPEVIQTYLGDVVEEYGYFLSAVEVADPAEPGIFYDPEAGKKLIAVNIIVGVTSGDPLSVNPLYASLVATDGFTYELELAGSDEQLATVDLFEGEKVIGWVAFSIPEEATPAKVKYGLELLGTQVLEAGLDEPPEGHVANSEALDLKPPEPESKLGDVVEQYGYSLSAVAVEDPTTPGILYTPKESTKLVGVEVIVGNVSGDTIIVNPLNSVLVDSNGYVYTAELGGRDDQIAVMDLNVGEKVKGWVSFVIPDDAIPYIVRYQIEFLTMNYLETGLGE